RTGMAAETLGHFAEPSEEADERRIDGADVAHPHLDRGEVERRAPAIVRVQPPAGHGHRHHEQDADDENGPRTFRWRFHATLTARSRARGAPNRASGAPRA